jgi:hypothetical protein
MRKTIHGSWTLIVALSVAGCTATTATAAKVIPTPVSSASARPSGSETAASAMPSKGASGAGTPSAAASPSIASPSIASSAGPLDLLPIPLSGSPWTDNTDALMGLEFTAATPDPAAAKALFLRQVEALKSKLAARSNRRRRCPR